MTKQSTLGLGLVSAGIAVAIAAFLLLASQAFAAGTVSVSDGTAPIGGGTVTVAVTGDAGSGAKIGSYNVEVAFDPTDYTGQPTFTSNPAGDCSFPSSGVLRCAGAAGTSGVQGDLATITFTTGASFTGCSDLTLTVVEFNDADAGNPLNPTADNGQVCLAAATASPTASPSASPSPTKAQPGGTTNTGGPQGDNGVSSLTWLLGITGLAIVAAGAWTLSRARREN
jgi:hypothetical protein